MSCHIWIRAITPPSTHPGGKEAGEGFDVNQGIAKLSERRRHPLPRAPRGAAAEHGRGASGDRDVLRVAARRDQANLWLAPHQLGLPVQHHWQVWDLWSFAFKDDIKDLDHNDDNTLTGWNDNNAAFRQLRSQLNSLGTMLPTVSQLQG